MVSRKTSIELLTPPSSVPRHPRTQAPNDHAHDTSYTSLHCPSKAAPPSPSASTSPPIPSRTSHPSYPDVPGPARPSSSFTNHERLHHQQLKGSILPDKQINHQILQPSHVFLATPHGSRIVRRRDAVGLVRPPPDLVHDAILQRRDTKKARQLPKLDQLEVRRVWPVQALVGQGSCVKPLGEVFEICRVALG